MEITFRPVSELNDTETAAIQALSRAVYPPEQHTDWPGRFLEWTPRQSCVLVWNANRTAVLTHVGIVVREARLQEMPVLIGGIGGVMTHPAFRNQGLAAVAIERCLTYLRDEIRADFGLLVCEPLLVPFYERLGWKLFSGPVWVQQHGRREEFTFNRVMTIPLQQSNPPTGPLDLLGPPW